MKSKFHYPSSFGPELSDHDVKRHTPDNERIGYQALSITAAAAALVFVVLAVFNVDSLVGAWGWVALALACIAMFIAFFPAAWLSVSRDVGPDDIRFAMDPGRSEHYYLERGVKDETVEPDPRGRLQEESEEEARRKGAE
jgi:hypothetical protein